MAKVYQLEVVGSMTQANFDKVAHSLLFADTITCLSGAPGSTTGKSIIVTSNVESESVGADYLLLADDSASEVAVDIATGKFVDGNLCAFIGLTSEAQSDLRNFVTFYSTSGDNHLHIGVCNTTQSQDYEPEIIARNRVRKMISPAQVATLGL